jgi:ATP-dependent protease ClpP protease subunit
MNLGKEKMGSMFSPLSADKPMYSYYPTGLEHAFYLVGEITEAEDYTDWFHIIRLAAPEDIVKIYINSPGGSLFTGIQLLRVLRETRAKVVVVVEGNCASAATIPVMVADEIQVSDHSVFMFHNYSGGIIGKGGEMYKQIMHQYAWSKKLLEDVYRNFLTQEEINRILENDDVWMDEETFFARIQKRIELDTADMEKQAAEQESQQKEYSTDDDIPLQG